MLTELLAGAGWALTYRRLLRWGRPGLALLPNTVRKAALARVPVIKDSVCTRIHI